jgi:hypothetical protein
MRAAVELAAGRFLADATHQNVAKPEVPIVLTYGLHDANAIASYVTPRSPPGTASV